MTYYGGWGIDLDEETTEIVAENHLLYRTTHGGLRQHYGRDNVVGDNIFAFRGAKIRRGGVEPHPSLTFEQNIVFLGRGPLFARDGDWAQLKADFDRNVYWRTEDPGSIDLAGKTWDQGRARGDDAQSRIADPRFLARGASTSGLRPIPRRSGSDSRR